MLPRLAIGPAVIELDYFAGASDRFESGQCIAHDGTLVVRIKGPPDGVSQRIINKNAARCLACFEDIECAANNNRGDAVGLKVSCYQTPGLMAHGSHRDQ